MVLGRRKAFGGTTSVATYVALTALCRAQDPEKFRFRTERYEYVDTIPAFDLLTGSAETREAILAGGDPRALGLSAGEADPGWPETMREAEARVEQAALAS
jgi:hypothetical protein